jgi:hypothetical protein
MNTQNAPAAKTRGATPTSVASMVLKKRERSPAYPFLSLREALGRVATLWQHEKRNSVPVPVAAGHWDYASKSSGAFQTIAALKQFGLVTDEGSGAKRHIRLSELALSILREEETSEPWFTHVKTAALKPQIHRDLWSRYGAELPSDKTIQTYLVFDRKFSEQSANALIKEYRDTATFAQLSESDTVEESETIGESEERNMNTLTDQLPSKTHSAGSVREFAVPLPSGAIAAFKIPFPMSEEDFKQYSSLLNAYKTAIVKKEEKE